MIQANELRIGNWYNQFGNYHQANCGTITDLSKSPDSQIWCKPIPLTPEILEKAGFSPEGVDYPEYYIINLYGEHFHLRVDTVNSRVSTGHSGNVADESRWGHIKSLHQLQNLYFALTNTELNIQL